MHRELIPDEMLRKRERAYPGHMDLGRTLPHCGSGTGSVDSQTRTAHLADPFALLGASEVHRVLSGVKQHQQYRPRI